MIKKVIFIVYLLACAVAADELEYDVVVFGATPGGIAAAVTASRLGRNVIMVERQAHVGGMSSSGLSISDVVTKSAYGGFFKEFSTRIYNFYVSTYGNSSENVVLCKNGIVYEPNVAELIFLEMLQEANVTFRLNYELDSVARDLHRVKKLHFKNMNTSETIDIKGKMFVDASYEGDLMAYAGADYQIGRESRAQYGELNAGKVFQEWKANEFLLGSTGESDQLVPAYTYRMSLTNDPTHIISVSMPNNYNRSIYLGYLSDVAAGRIPSVLNAMSALVVTVPNNKTDLNINPHPLGFVFAGLNTAYPDGNWTVRDQIASNIKDITLGLLYFLQNDLAVNETDRKAALEWGMDDREFNDTQYFPRQLYVREARRLIGEYIFTEHDLIPVTPSSRTPSHRDTISVGEYPVDIFPVSGELPNPAQSQQITSATPEGYIGMYQNFMRPFQIPMRALFTSKKHTESQTTKSTKDGSSKNSNYLIENLVVPVALSASHVGFSSLRLEPTWMNIGAAAGAICHVALQETGKIQDVIPEKAQRVLIAAPINQLLTWYSDMTDPYAFESMQFLGTKNFFSSYSVLPSDPASRIECASWLSKVFRLIGVHLPHGNFPQVWQDLDPSNSNFDDVLGLALLGIIPLPSQNKYFYPQQQISASDFNSWLVQAAEVLNIPPTSKAIPNYSHSFDSGLTVGDVCISLDNFLLAAGF